MSLVQNVSLSWDYRTPLDYSVFFILLPVHLPLISKCVNTLYAGIWDITTIHIYLVAWFDKLTAFKLRGLWSDIGTLSITVTVCSSTYQWKHQSSASLAFVRGIHSWRVDSLTKGQQRGKFFHMVTSSWTFQMTVSFMGHYVCISWPIISTDRMAIILSIRAYRPSLDQSSNLHICLIF